jgi:hypothetical protein
MALWAWNRQRKLLKPHSGQLLSWDLHQAPSDQVQSITARLTCLELNLITKPYTEYIIIYKPCVGFKCFTTVTVKHAVFWDVAPCGFITNQRFRGTCSPCLTFFLDRVISSTLKMVATRSSETSVYNKPTWCHIPEDAFFIHKPHL